MGSEEGPEIEPGPPPIAISEDIPWILTCTPFFFDFCCVSRLLYGSRESFDPFLAFFLAFPCKLWA